MKKVLFYVFLWSAVFVTMGILCIYDAPVWAFLLMVGFAVILWAIVRFVFKREFFEWLNNGKYEDDFYTDDNIGLSGEGFRFESKYSKGFEDCYNIALSAEFDRAFEVLYTPEQLELPDFFQAK